MTGRQLAQAVVRPGEWMERGACRDADETLFFHPEGETGAAKEQRISDAKDVCDTCPVLAQCRTYALAVPEPYGIWGGLSEDDRAAIRSGESVDTTKRLHLEPYYFPATKVERTLAPEVVIGHLNRLVDAGFTTTAVARFAGVNPDTVRTIMRGTKKQVFRTTAEKLLSVRVREAVAS